MARLPRDAAAFYAIIGIATLLGVVLNFSEIDPTKALFWSAVLNGVVAVPPMAILMLISARQSIMGQFVLPRPLAVMGWIATCVMAATVIGMFGTLGS